MKKKAPVRGPIDRVEAPVDQGLNEEQVKARQEAGYGNAVTDRNDKTTAEIVFKNVFTFFNTILLSIAVLFAVFIIYLYATGNSEVVDKHFGFSKFLFLIPAILNVTIGTIQELHSRKIIKSLRIVSEAKCRVMRAGQAQKISASALVIDDVVLLTAGDQAVADLVVVSGEVSVDESMLTGESDYIKKLPGDKILSGSAVIVGEAKARVIEVGDETYAAKLSAKVKSSEAHKSELMQTIFRIIRGLSIALVVLEIVVIGTLVFKIKQNGGDASVFDMPLSLSDPVAWARIMITGGSFGVGVIPSGLVLTTSVTLMLSIVALSRKQTLIQELYSLENLSRVDVICLDKTGTLTDGTMSVKDVKYFAHMEEVVEQARNLMASTENRNATAEAIFEKFGSAPSPVHSEIIPFSSATKCSGIVYPDGRKLLMGAPEYLLPAGDERLSFVEENAAKGFRVIALMLDGRLLCFFVIEDHIRESAAGTLQFFRENGVTVKIISGDNPITVSKIAQACGVENADKYISLEKVKLEDIPSIAEEYTVFARVSPEQKEALVRALQEKKHKVAMTGDGVNDILALRRSDSSITFAKATEAAKSCSDVVLMDNDFSHLKDVVGEGRRVIGNVQRSSVLFLMKSVAIIVMAFALIPFKKGQMWFSIENAYMLEAAVIGIGGVLLSLEAQRQPIRGSFMQAIRLKGAAAGILAAISVLLPIVLYVVPSTPLIHAENVRTMMSILLLTAGIVIVTVMCIPFNKYRVFVLCAVIFVALLLGFALPTSYIGGNPTGAKMFAYDSSLGQTVMDSVFMREFMRPWNSEVVKNLRNDPASFYLAQLFLFFAIPVFVVAMDLINYRIEKKSGGPVRPIFTLVSIAKQSLLITGIVLFINSFLNVGSETIAFISAQDGEKSAAVIVTLSFAVAFFLIKLFMSAVALKIWRTGKTGLTRAAIAAGGLLVAVTGAYYVVEAILTGSNAFIGKGILETISNILIDFVLTAAYILTAVAVRYLARKQPLQN